MNGTSKAIVNRDFSMFTGMLKAIETTDGRMTLSGIASSTIKDRHGDTMTPNALAAMLRSADGMTIYLNHSYDVPEDVAGTVRRAWIDKASTDLHDLHFEIEINAENDRATQTWRAINAGTKLGLSIGAMIPEGGAKRMKNSSAFIIDDVELLETSIVSIPANPRSWVDYARKALMLKALNGETIPEDDDEEEVLKDGEDDPESAPVDPTPESVTMAEMSSEHRNNLPDSAFADPKNRKYPHHTASGGIDRAHLANALSRCAQDATSCSPAVKAHLEAHARSLGMGDRSKKELGDGLWHHVVVDAAGTWLDGVQISKDFDETHFQVTEEDLAAALEDPGGEPLDTPEFGAGLTEQNLSSSNAVSDSGTASTMTVTTNGTSPSLIDNAQVTVWPSGKVNVVTGPPDTSQAPSEAEPGTEESNAADALSAALGEMARDLDPEVQKTLGPTFMATLQSSHQITVALLAALNAANERATAAESERDKALEVLQLMQVQTEAFITRVAAYPRGRRAIAREIPQTAKALQGIRESGLFGDEFLNVIEKGVKPE